MAVSPTKPWTRTAVGASLHPQEQYCHAEVPPDQYIAHRWPPQQRGNTVRSVSSVELWNRGVTYQHPSYKMGPSQPFGGLNSSTSWFKESFHLHQGEQAMVVSNVCTGTGQSFFDCWIHVKLGLNSSTGVVLLQSDWVPHCGDLCG